MLLKILYYTSVWKNEINFARKFYYHYKKRYQIEHIYIYMTI